MSRLEKILVLASWWFVIPSLIFFVGSHLHLPQLVMAVAVLAIGGWGSWSLREKPSKKTTPRSTLAMNIGLVIYGFCSMIVLNGFTFVTKYDATGLTIEKGTAHDMLWHIALTQQLLKQIPPANPLFQGELLQGYHYFNDIWWALIHQISGISITFLLTLVAPVVLTAYFVGSAFVVMKAIIKDHWLALLGASLLTMGAGLAFVGPFVLTGSNFSQSLFWLDQPTQYSWNQQLLLSLGLVNIVVFLLWRGERRWWLLGTLLGALAGIKVYGLMVWLPALWIGVVWQVWRNREWQWARIAGWASVVGGLTLFLARSPYGWPFIWDPGWFFKTAFEAHDRINLPVWELQRQVFAAAGNWPRLLIHWGWAAAVFFVGNFGVKLTGLFLLVVAGWRTRRQLNKLVTPHLMLWLAVICGSFLAPTLFIQKGTVWNTVQFLHYAQLPLILVLITSLTLAVKKIKWQRVILGFLLVLSLPTTAFTLHQTWFELTRVWYPSSLLQELQALKPVAPDAPLLVSPFLQETSLVSAISGREVYYADPTINDILVLPKQPRFGLSQAIATGGATLEVCPPKALYLDLNASKTHLKITPCSWLVATYSAQATQSSELQPARTPSE